MCYLRRTQRISISAIHEIFFGSEDRAELDPTDVETLNRLSHLPGDEMTADVLTKLLDPETHWKHLLAMGMVPVAPGHAGH